MTNVSVVIPTLNEEKSIGKTLTLVSGQKTRLDFDIVVSDGGSRDGTVSIAEKHAVKVILGEKRGIW